MLDVATPSPMEIGLELLVELPLPPPPQAVRKKKMELKNQVGIWTSVRNNYFLLIENTIG
jgi:hypothetical protein